MAIDKVEITSGNWAEDYVARNKQRFNNMLRDAFIAGFRKCAGLVRKRDVFDYTIHDVKQGLTLECAIARAKKKADQMEGAANDCNMGDPVEREMAYSNRACAADYYRLFEWLSELKERRDSMSEKKQIKRRRFCVMRKNRTEVWCGLARNFEFKPIDKIGDTAIKTYRSEAQARTGCSSWDRDFEIVSCVEILIIEETTHIDDKMLYG